MVNAEGYRNQLKKVRYGVPSLFGNTIHWYIQRGDWDPTSLAGPCEQEIVKVKG